MGWKVACKFPEEVRYSRETRHFFAKKPKNCN